MLFANNSCCSALKLVAAALCEQKVFTGVIAVSQGCCQHDFHSSIKQLRMLFANNSCCSALNLVAAALCEQKVFTGVIAVSQGCCQPVLQTSIDL